MIYCYITSLVWSERVDVLVLAAQLTVCLLTAIAKDNIKMVWDYGIGHIGLMECHKWDLNQCHRLSECHIAWINLLYSICGGAKGGQTQPWLHPPQRIYVICWYKKLRKKEKNEQPVLACSKVHIYCTSVDLGSQ